MTAPAVALVSMHTSPADLPGSGDAGGMNVVELAQAQALAALGQPVELITRRQDPAAPDVLELAPGVRLRHLTAGPPQPLPKSEIDNYLDDFTAGLAALDGYRLYHSHHWMSGMAALPVARRRGVPHVQSFHSVAAPIGSPLGRGEPPESERRIAGEALLAKDSDLVVAISAAEARTVIERCGADPDRVSIVQPGVDLELFRPRRPGEKCWPLPAGRAAGDAGYLLFAGRIQPLKGPDLAIEALAGVPPEIRPLLVIAGDVAADFAGYAEELRALVDRLGLTDDVVFGGSLSRAELAHALRCATMMLVPSHSETFGLVALEAAASGVPVIAASAGGLREAVVHLETGQLIDSREPTAWADTISSLLRNRKRLERMGIVARVHARRFRWDEVGVRLLSIYRELVERA
ncbi:glycosyltransferase [Nakamurella aerolata]|uniref:Glycosyltransferase n=1 Tax=Nakamurella aerolata TaxID=1656892 RepID=A0A849A3S2_9ACTN|nr:glycosyltransferase [Nakamurella aerolata]NNG35664.1 glycosyltransferase [Nakamurella aerolata]